jgi:GntR family transcriptional repressor for pyruvate dehydrogenase complex
MTTDHPVTHRVTRIPLTGQVAEGIIDLILQEGLGEGFQLPATADLAERFDVSRPVVREAIAELAARGIVHRQQGRVTVVSAPGQAELGGMLRFHVAFHQLPSTAVHEYRQAIEVAAARLAAQRRTTEQMDALELQIEVLAKAKGEESLQDADVRFHRLVAESSDNQLLILALDAIEGLNREQRSKAWGRWEGRDKGRTTVVRSHRAIMEAIRDQDPSLAADAMLSHLYEAQAAFEGISTPMQ